MLIILNTSEDNLNLHYWGFFWPFWCNATTCKLKIGTLSPQKVDMCCLFTHPADMEQHLPLFHKTDKIENYN